MEKFTKEDAKNFIYDKSSEPLQFNIHIKDIEGLVTKIYDQHEIELEQMFHKGVLNGNEAMKTKMEEEFKERDCENCRYYNSTNCPINLFLESALHFEKYPFSCNRWEKK